MMTIRIRLIPFFMLAVTLLAASPAFAANPRTATFPRYAKSYEVSSYMYFDDREDPPLEFQALAGPIQVPVEPGAAVVSNFKPPFQPNRIVIIARWNNPGQPSINSAFTVQTGAQGGDFTWKWPCFRLDEFPATCCPEDPQNQSYFCCTDPLLDFVCDDTCMPGGGAFSPPELFGDPDGTDVPSAIVPTVSEWGLIIMTLLTMSLGTIMIARRGANRAASLA